MVDAGLLVDRRHELAVQAFCCIPVCGLSCFNGRKASEVVTDTVCRNLSGEPRSVPNYPNGEVFGPFGNSVLGILISSCWPKIVPGIVECIAIFVIYLWNIFSSYQLPNYTVGVIGLALYSNLYPSGVVRSNDIAGNGPSISRIHSLIFRRAREMFARTFAPRQFSAYWIVCEALAQILLIWYRLGRHVVLATGYMVRGGIDARNIAAPPYLLLTQLKCKDYLNG